MKPRKGNKNKNKNFCGWQPGFTKKERKEERKKKTIFGWLGYITNHAHASFVRFYEVQFNKPKPTFIKQTNQTKPKKPPQKKSVALAVAWEGERKEGEAFSVCVGSGRRTVSGISPIKKDNFFLKKIKI